MKYTNAFVKMIAILMYIPIGYIVYLYVTRFPKYEWIINVGWGFFILLLLLMPIRMWKDTNKL
ncbi:MULTISPECIES: hypothetical protein [Bacillus cereus group]|uniref:hypothetical protein n=1 Tax=Bacillus cereus group TaxID=86661 RepID=UPI0027EE1C64|nr:hypothetical protein [Bacillus thuringiensis]HDT6577474.1 hypothetical protein [Bacillus cereus]